jgi:hypothetical protein
MEGISEKHFGTFQNEIKAYMRYLVHGGTPLSETNFRHGSTTDRRHDDERIYVAGDLLSVPSEAGGGEGGVSTLPAPELRRSRSSSMW